MTDWINHFQHPWVLALLPLPLLLLLWQKWKGGRAPSVVYSGLEVARGIPLSLRQRVMGVLPYSRALVLLLGITALARPQHGTTEYDVNAEGIDIVMCIDVSGSMQMQDFAPNRLEAAKAAAAEFVSNRTRDRVAITLFGANTAILSPPTLDMSASRTFIESIHDGIILNHATAIGDGIGISTQILKDSEAASKVILLLTDGENNSGRLEPLQAADIAKALGIRIYTIGVGRDVRAGGGALIGRGGGDFDSAVLREIADRTGGRYFSAANEQALNRVYDEIDAMERSEIEVEETATYSERFMYFWFPALALLLGELGLRAFWLRRLP